MSRQTITILLLFLLAITHASAQDYFIPLWDSVAMPNSKGMKLKDSISNERIFQVGTPGMYAFFPSEQENKHAAVIICPGGGYQRLAYVISGLQLAKWFNTIGITAFVLNYRLPQSPDLVDKASGPITDAQRAIRYVRANAAKWAIDTNKIGIQGSSAGGHLAALAGTITKDYSKAGDKPDQYGYQTNFAILVSPVVDMGEYAHAGSKKALLGQNPSQKVVDMYSPQLNVNSTTPPTFIVNAFNDNVVNPMNGILLYETLLKNKIPSTLHIFPAGAHSIALRNNPGSTNLWTDICVAWLKEISIIE